LYLGASKLTSLFGKSKKGDGDKEEDKGPKVVKTTTKQLVVKDSEGVTENIEEKIEDMASGEVQMSTHVNKVLPNFYLILCCKLVIILDF